MREARPGLQRLTLQRLVGSAHTAVYTGRGMGYARIDEFAPLCLAPCEMDVEAGTYQFGVSEADGDGHRISNGPMQLTGPTSFVLDYENRSGLRAAGWVTFVSAMVVGLALAFVPLFLAVGDRGSSISSARRSPLLRRTDERSLVVGWGVRRNVAGCSVRKTPAERSFASSSRRSWSRRWCSHGCAWRPSSTG